MQSEIEKLKIELTLLYEKQNDLKNTTKVSEEDRVNLKALELRVKELEKENTEQKLKYHNDISDIKIIHQQEIHDLKLAHSTEISEIKLKYATNQNKLDWKFGKLGVLGHFQLITSHPILLIVGLVILVLAIVKIMPFIYPSK